MLYGYIGKMLFVNLTKKTYEVRELTEELARNFLGGYGIGARILYDEMPANCDAFDEKSMFGIVTGPTNGTNALFGGRYTVVSKSPVTGGWNDANSGGYFSPKLKASGFDAVFVNGISDKPVYIFIDDGKVEIRDASHLWGLTSIAFEEKIEEECGKDVKSAFVGPAGENLSLYAAVMNDAHRAAGRGGTGAVMGSKKLKAIVCRGTHKTPVFDQEKLTNLNKAIVQHMNNEGRWARESFGTYGTAGIYLGSVLTNDASIKNWSGTAETDYPEEEAFKCSGQAMDPQFMTKKYNCANCPLGCGAIYEVKEGKWPLEHTTRPEYETLGAWGSQMANSSPESIIICNHLCNEYGFDTISMGASVAWAMECYEKGVLSKEELDGIELNWGNGDAIVEMAYKICNNEGIGKILAQGSQKAAEIFNKGYEYLVVAGGIEEPQHDSRLAFHLARCYQFDPTPGRHVKGQGRRMHEEGKEDDFSLTGFTDMMGVVSTEIQNCSGVCSFMGMCSPTDTANYDQVNTITGFNYSSADIVSLGLRIFNMRHAFNLREGKRRKDFTLSERFFKSDPPFTGPIAGVVVDYDMLADNFFNTIGWTKDAVPTEASLSLLGGLDDVKKSLYPDEE